MKTDPPAMVADAWTGMKIPVHFSFIHFILCTMRPCAFAAGFFLSKFTAIDERAKSTLR
tara:strand:+ start:211 stop:387 length:177 start_codon:yes stop_codon:yes gene_type:complete